MKPDWRITVLAGVNGAGKSSVAGAAIRREGTEYWNPDEVAREILSSHPGTGVEEANAKAWRRGVAHLLEALANRRSFTFETTLGGRTITGILERGIREGAPVHIWYIGLEGVELHLARVEERVRRGGHDIPDETIRSRYRSSRENLVRLMPGLARLIVYDNSAPSAPDGTVTPRHLLTTEERRITRLAPLLTQPAWARPIIMRAIELERQ